MEHLGSGITTINCARCGVKVLVAKAELATQRYSFRRYCRGCKDNAPPAALDPSPLPFKLSRKGDAA